LIRATNPESLFPSLVSRLPSPVSRLHRQAQHEFRAAFGAIRGAHAATMFLRDLLDHGEAESGAVALAGRVGFEPAIAEVGGQAGAVVADHEFDPVAIGVLDDPRLDVDLRLAARTDCLEG